MNLFYLSVQSRLSRIKRAHRNRDFELRFTIFILILLSLLLSGIVLLVGSIVYQEVFQSLPSMTVKTLWTIPVLCEDLSLSPDEDFETFDAERHMVRVSVNTEGKYTCEGKHFTEIIYKIVERQSRLRLSKGLANEHYISCGKENLRRKSGSKTVSFTKVSHHTNIKENASEIDIHWDTNKQYSYLGPDIHYHNGEITISEGQIYFVYASVHIDTRQSILKTPRYTTGRHIFKLQICRKYFEYEEILLNKIVPISRDNGFVETTLRVEGPLNLNRNDIIYVKVSDGNRVILNSRGNTFGLYPL